MKPNISVFDGMMRIFLACFFGIAGGALSVYDSPFAIIGFLALPLIVTGLSGYSLAYIPFGYYTCEENPYERDGNFEALKSEKNQGISKQFAH